ncbi:MAG: hypothetical protein H6711_21525 [Myxococcales bacterium]|nr:hypothetical protein [Myxococcales bacterium]
MHAPIDLSRYIQRRHFRAYERDMARGTYGYGVDLRRTRWLTASMAGQAPLRALEHAWVPLADSLMGEELRFAERPGDIPILSEIVEIARLLHTTPPALRLLTPAAQRSGEWGFVTPLSDPRGSDEWLVLDLDALQRQPERERAFLLGAGLGHLHCGHGALFAAHLVSHRRGRGNGLIRALLRPWVKVAVFSADRAGLLAASELPAALVALETAAATTPGWWPAFPTSASDGRPWRSSPRRRSPRVFARGGGARSAPRSRRTCGRSPAPPSPKPRARPSPTRRAPRRSTRAPRRSPASPTTPGPSPAATTD